MADGPRLTLLGKLIIALFVLGCFFGAWYLWPRGNTSGGPSGGPAAGPQAGTASGPAAPYTGPVTELGIAYGTEKETWLKWAVEEYRKTPEGQRVRINLLPMGSLEGAQAIYRDENKNVHVWSPAGSAYKDAFVQEWQPRHGNSPILKEERLALTPMVFVMWDERYKVFQQKYPALTFGTVREALQEEKGWDGIAGKETNWGLFKFSHTHPAQSNSGLMTLMLLAYDYHNKSRGLVLKDVLDPKFLEWMQGIEKGVSRMPHSTGDLMKDMTLYGPSTFDAMLVYESVVIDYLKKAEGRWGPFQVVYPKYNVSNENPYYILDVPWSTADHRQAAAAFLQFLMSEPIQKQALVHGFRPGNPDVPVLGVADSPFDQYKQYGLKIDVGTVSEPPRAEVLTNLLEAWRRKLAR
jgi:ABC-type Fe3+ transport system substrate-binding protein